jgi:glutamyl-tRNA synthetase
MSQSNVVDPHLKVQQFSQLQFGTGGAAASPASPGKKQAEGAAKAKADHPQVKTPAHTTTAAAATEENEDKLVLTNAVEGAVMTRFPPEASGFLHIGHAKAALINSMLRYKYKGKMLFRFDDTNPEKENPEFEQAIMHDLGLLGVKWDIGPTYSSDHFPYMMQRADELVAKGLMYADTTPKEEMRKARFDGVPTKCRSHSIEENQRLWAEMKKGSPEGQTACMRAKISIDNENKAMRDPTMYRVNLHPHPRQGDKYKVYPTYDWCCPIVDSVEGVTHALRTNEYHDRNDQYYWICDALNLRKPTVEDFSRLNMEYSLMSKRKLTQLVADGAVDGWDDPRFPTVRGLVRRGLQIEALSEFVKVQGMSKAVNLMEWSKLWNFNNQILDPSVARYTVVSDETKVHVKVIGAPGKLVGEQKARHKKNDSLGLKTYYKSDEVLLDAEDVLLLKDGEEVTFMDWGNAFITEIVKDASGTPVSATATLNPQGDVKKTKYKLTWVPVNPKNVTVIMHEFDHILTKKKPEEGDDLDAIVAKVTKFTMRGLAEEALAEVQQGQTIQFERRGYYRVDAVAPQLVLHAIPDGRDKLNHLSAKAQYIKKNAPAPAAGATKPAAAPGKAEDAMTLEEKRAAKAAKKAASGPKK